MHALAAAVATPHVMSGPSPHPRSSSSATPLSCTSPEIADIRPMWAWGRVERVVVGLLIAPTPLEHRRFCSG